MKWNGIWNEIWNGRCEEHVPTLRRCVLVEWKLKMEFEVHSRVQNFRMEVHSRMEYLQRTMGFLPYI